MIEPAPNPLRDAAMELLAARPMSGAELVSALDGLGLLEELKEELDPEYRSDPEYLGDPEYFSDPDYLVDVVIDEVATTDDLWVTGDDRLILTEPLVDGLVLTHRVTAEEIEAGGVRIDPDLTVLDWNLEHGQVELATGGSLEETTIGEPVPGEANTVLAGPPGWLGEVRPGDLVTFTRRGRSVSLEIVTPQDLAPDDREIAALRAGVEGQLPHGAGDEVVAILMEALASDPLAWRKPVRPLTELLPEAGLEHRGFSYGRIGEPWLSPGERYIERQRRELAEGLEACCASRFEEVCDAYTQFCADGTVDGPAVLERLRHGPVVAVFAKFAGKVRIGREASLRDFGAALAAVGRRHGAGLYLLGFDAERRGDLAAAESAYRSALTVDPGLAMAAQALSRFHIDRGEYRRAISLLSHERLDPNDLVLVTLSNLAAPSDEFASVGRNDPCPCGSGRKFKQCHLGRANRAFVDPVGMVQLKVLFFGTHRDDRLVITRLAIEAADPDEPDMIAAIRPFTSDEAILDFAAWEGGIAEAYLAARGELLPPDERRLIESILAEPRRLWEVTSVDPGVSLELRDTKTGREVFVEEHAGSLGTAPGELRLIRVVECDGKPRLCGPGIKVTLAQRGRVMEILDNGADAAELAEWYGSLRALPQLHNREGDPLLLCTGTLSTSLGGEEVIAALDAVFEREFAEGSGASWIERFELPNGEVVVRGMIRWSDGTITLETNSVRRYELLLARVTEAIPDATVTDLVQSDPRAALRERREQRESGGAPPEAGPGPVMTPELAEMMDNLMREQEERWTTSEIPALGGLTPRQALEDPTRREDLLSLLREFDEMPIPPGGYGFNVDRIRALLGLTDS
jgi:hypothetical protein